MASRLGPQRECHVNIGGNHEDEANSIGGAKIIANLTSSLTACWSARLLIFLSMCLFPTKHRLHCHSCVRAVVPVGGIRLHEGGWKAVI